MTVPYVEKLPYCSLCHRDIDPNGKTTYRKVTGWEKNRGDGEGTQATRERRFAGEFAHALCLDVHSRGEDPKQMYEKTSLL